jgi:hypothetical protein
VVEKIYTYTVPFVLFSVELSSQDQDFSSQHPEDHSDRFSGVVIARDSNINVLKVVVGITKSDNRDGCVRSFLKSLVVSVRVYYNDHLWFLELSSHRVSERTWSPSGGRGYVTPGVGSELNNSSLSGVSGRDSVDILKVFNTSDDSSSEFNSSVGFVDLESWNSLFREVVDESLHLYIVVSGTNVALGVEETEYVIFSFVKGLTHSFRDL